MKYYLLSFITTISIAILFYGCSKLQENITQPQALSIHSKGNLDTSSVNFHGKILHAANFNFDACKKCHAADSKGGITNVSCYGCHNYPHKQGYLDTTSVDFHGVLLKSNNFNSDACKKCHATDFRGGNTNVSCYSCHNYPHQQGYLDASSVNFHGDLLKTNNFNSDACKKCHATDFQGGNTNVSCYNCHNYPHQKGITDPTSSNFHGKILLANNFIVDECQKCHGTDFSGNGSNQLSCRNCHSQTEGPLACNTCHGKFDDPSRIAPPRDINGNTSTNFITVGAHVSHLYENDFAVVACENCHIVPNAINVKNHFNPGPQAKIVKFDSLAVHGIASNAIFNSNTGTCSNTYCHGNFEFKKSDAPAERQYAYTSDKMTGNYKTVKWTSMDGSQAPCGSCHGTTDGFISPIGHIKLTITQCVACHSTVVNEKGEIIDKTKHLNGQINYALSK